MIPESDLEKEGSRKKVLFIKIVLSFSSLIPCLILPTDDRENSEGTPTQLPVTQKCFLLRLPPKKVDYIPKKVDCVPEIVANPQNKKTPKKRFFLLNSKYFTTFAPQRSINEI